MSKVWQSVSFFDPSITLAVDSSNQAGRIGDAVTIAEFARGSRVSVEQNTRTGRLKVTRESGIWVAGDEVITA